MPGIKSQSNHGQKGSNLQVSSQQTINEAYHRGKS